MNVLSLCGQEVGLTKNPSVRYTCPSYYDTIVFLASCIVVFLVLFFLFFVQYFLIECVCR